ncbi:MAG TPA: MBL fold metallo-hydrolase [Gaiellales bacterium]|jgi:L-ascorbate metabolism protein UlaG (beta-lactamase superfamily)
MNIRWHGQSAYTLTGSDHVVAIDPFGDLGALMAGRRRFEYPPVPQHDAHLLLVTHEHADHNAVEAITGSPQVVRSTAGRFESPVGEVVAIASEHDDEAGTSRGPNTIFVFSLDGVRVCHFGDFGQSALRPQQRDAIGAVDLLIVPVGGGPTIDAAQAAEITRALDPRWVVPMHYRTPAIDFLEPADAFLALFDEVETAGSEHPIAQDGGRSTGVLHLAPPGRD